MSARAAPESGARPILLLTVACLVTIGGMLWSVWAAYDSARKFGAVSEEGLRLEQLRGQILHFDEILTMSARMAAATGDPLWEARYREAEPQLTDAIEAAQTLVPEADATGQTDAANDALVALEDQAFALVRDGRLEDARDVLASDDYAGHKAVYAAGMTALGDRLNAVARETTEAVRKRAGFQFVGSLIALPLLIAGWWFVLGVMNRWRRDIASISASQAFT